PIPGGGALHVRKQPVIVGEGRVSPLTRHLGTHHGDWLHGEGRPCLQDQDGVVVGQAFPGLVARFPELIHVLWGDGPQLCCVGHWCSFLLCSYVLGWPSGPWRGKARRGVTPGCLRVRRTHARMWC